MNTDEMPAGSEMDALVAEKVMGSVPCDKWRTLTAYPPQWIKGKAECEHAICYPLEGPPNYSTSIAAAWKVVEKIREDYEPRIELWDEGWEVTILTGTDRGSASGRALTAPLAICRAALKAV